MPFLGTSVPTNGGTFTYPVIASSQSCTWTAISNQSWLTIINGSGTGNGSLTIFVEPHNGTVNRTAKITIGGITPFFVGQSSICIASFTFTPATNSFPAEGGNGSISVNAPAGCTWTAASHSSWITVTSGSSGTGAGTINYTVAPNPTTAARRGGIGILGYSPYLITQERAKPTKFDFDGDGKADISVYRPSLGAWYINQSSNNAFSGMLWGLPGDVITPADFDGDGRTDAAVFRDGYWYLLNSSNNSFSAVKFGQTGDVPIPSDYDNDGKADVAVFRENVPGAGNRAYFYILQSSDNSFRAEQFGVTGDKPVSADFDKDGKADLAVYRDGSLSGGQSYFFYRQTSQPGTNFSTIAWGVTGDRPAPADFDGDGKQDAAVFRPSTGDWYILRSSDNQFTAIHFGISEDIPVAADYDGDGKADVAVFRPSTGSWYLQRSTAGFTGMQFGVSTDKPIPALVQ